MVRKAITSALWLTAVVALALSAREAAAQDYPSKPIKIIVPVAPGGLTDSLARFVGDTISARTGQQVVVENRSGASGNIAMEALARSKPDGYTLGIANTGDLTVNPVIYKNLSFDARRDLVPVAMIADAPQLLVVNSELPVKTLQEFIAYSKAHPGAINYGTAGAGSLTNIGALQLARLAGLKIVPVAYRGVVPAVTDLIAGRIQMMHTSLGGIIAHVRSGRVRVLVVTAPERWTEFLPEVPTSAEAGLPDYTMSIWFSLAAPRQTPRPIIEQLNGYVRAMASDPVTRKRITDNFVRPASMTADQVQTFVKGEESRWERVVRDLGVTIN